MRRQVYSFLPFFIALPLYVSCVQVKQEDHSTPQATDVPAQSATPQVTRSAEDRIEIIIHHPGANQKNVYYAFYRQNLPYLDQNGQPVPDHLLKQLQADLSAGKTPDAPVVTLEENDNRYLVPIKAGRIDACPKYMDDTDSPADGEAIEALLEAATSDLIEADAFYGCRSVENGRQIRMRWTRASADNTSKHRYEITTASNCLNFAPFNVVIDGKRYLQLNGKIGQALTHLLQADPKFRAQQKHLKAGFIDFTKPFSGNPDDAKATSLTPLLEAFDTRFKSDARLKAILDARNADTTNPSWQTTLELGCNQSKSPTCDSLVGRYTIPLSPETHYYLSLTYEDSVLKANFPTDFSVVRRSFEQPVIRTFIENTSRPVTVAWSSPQTCPVLDALAPWFEDKGNAKNTDTKTVTAQSCDAWSFTSADKQQSLIYYPRLDATWIAGNEGTVRAAILPLATKKYLPKTTKKFISNLAKTDVTNKNIFFDGQSNLYLFETKDGKTTCTTCQ